MSTAQFATCLALFLLVFRGPLEALLPDFHVAGGVFLLVAYVVVRGMIQVRVDQRS